MCAELFASNTNLFGRNKVNLKVTMDMFDAININATKYRKLINIQ